MRTRKFIIPVLLIAILTVNIVELFQSRFGGDGGGPSIEITGALLDYENTDKAGGFVPVTYNKNYDQMIMSWGIKRATEGRLPAADPGAADLIQKYGGYYLGDTAKNKIYLTFDEGYEAGYTSKMLDTLRENNVKAIFFVTGHYLRDQEVLIRRMLEEGHEVGNHSVNHPCLPDLDNSKIDEELNELDKMFFEKFNKHMKFFRSPRGEYNERVLARVQSLGYTNMFWSLAYCDWNKNKQKGIKYAHDMVINNLHNGAIILLHAVSPDNMMALDSIIKDARAKGYEFGSFDDFR